ncbi:tetratricopeptide repeat protein [Planctomicrobium piriforme]|uniref:protein O-GlcNAc transferase n=1 Tax=Planctomicrobium piriforme TaxID=1576369 RepID=A0A1I3G4H8_9PLAN|nr:glycosyltransferase family 41 protein [Planctomicrobium piriforme]SFI18366.1 Tetratricopeptide repeat-containing protein [Planctomicrobium piriforme]
MTTLLDAQDAHRNGHLVAAETAYRTLLREQRSVADAAHGLALVYAQQSRLDESLPLFQQAIQAAPQRPDFWNNLAEAERRAGRLRESIAHFQKALQLAPQFPDAWFNLGCALSSEERLSEAVDAFRRAIALRPNYPRAYFNLGNVLRKEGKMPVAAEAYRKACEQQANWWEPQYNLAVTLLDLGETESALQKLQQVRAAVPASMEVEATIGGAYARQGLAREAKEWYQQLAGCQPDSLLARLRCELVEEVIPQSDEAIRAGREQALTLLRSVAGSNRIEINDELHRRGSTPPMSWTYHGLDDRPLREALAAIYLQAIEPVSRTARVKSACPHVGVVVTHGHEGVFDRCWGALANQLAERGRVRVSLVSTQAGLNTLRHLRPGSKCGEFVVPESLPQAARVLAASDIDLLYYWEVGTDAFNYLLPFFQPVEQQWAGWGWPITAGHERITGYLSSSLLEPAGAEQHYTERLVQMPVLPTYYERPPVPQQAVSRSEWGLPEQGPLLLCQQNLRKWQPGFDRLVGEILRRQPTARLAVIADEQQTISKLFMDRLQRSIPDVFSRIQLLSRMSREKYLSLVASADLILDPPGYGAGANTALDAAAAGTPVVTLTGEFHRGRWQTAVNEQLGVKELSVASAKEYVETVCRLLEDEEQLRSLRERIQQVAPQLFCQMEAVTAFEEFFLAQCR